jgi:hypothetical protein
MQVDFYAFEGHSKAGKWLLLRHHPPILEEQGSSHVTNSYHSELSELGQLETHD